MRVFCSPSSSPTGLAKTVSATVSRSSPLVTPEPMPTFSISVPGERTLQTQGLERWSPVILVDGWIERSGQCVRVGTLVDFQKGYINVSLTPIATVQKRVVEDFSLRGNDMRSSDSVHNSVHSEKTPNGALRLCNWVWNLVASFWIDNLQRKTNSWRHSFLNEWNALHSSVISNNFAQLSARGYVFPLQFPLQFFPELIFIERS